LGGPKKPKPVVMRWIGPRRSGPKWQERMRNRNSKSGKQMTTDASRLMRPEASAPGGTALCGYMSVLPSGFTVVRGQLARWPVGQPASSIRWCWPYEGLSRNEGKLSSTVLRGGRAGNSPPPLGVASGWPQTSYQKPIPRKTSAADSKAAEDTHPHPELRPLYSHAHAALSQPCRAKVR
jgi:hypothetical protein